MVVHGRVRKRVDPTVNMIYRINLLAKMTLTWKYPLTSKVLADSRELENGLHASVPQNPENCISDPLVGGHLEAVSATSKATYVTFPTPESSMILGLPMVPAASIASFRTLTLCTTP